MQSAANKKHDDVIEHNTKPTCSTKQQKALWRARPEIPRLHHLFEIFSFFEEAIRIITNALTLLDQLPASFDITRLREQSLLGDVGNQLDLMVRLSYFTKADYLFVIIQSILKLFLHLALIQAII